MRFIGCLQDLWPQSQSMAPVYIMTLDFYVFLFISRFSPRIILSVNLPIFVNNAQEIS
jgi:hypothetical protein